MAITAQATPKAGVLPVQRVTLDDIVSNVRPSELRSLRFGMDRIIAWAIDLASVARRAFSVNRFGTTAGSNVTRVSSMSLDLRCNVCRYARRSRPVLAHRA